MNYDTKGYSENFVEPNRADFIWSSADESRKILVAQALQVLYRQRRIAERLAAFEREVQKRAARGMDEGFA